MWPNLLKSKNARPRPSPKGECWELLKDADQHDSKATSVDRNIGSEWKDGDLHWLPSRPAIDRARTGQALSESASELRNAKSVSIGLWRLLQAVLAPGHPWLNRAGEQGWQSNDWVPAEEITPSRGAVSARPGACRQSYRNMDGALLAIRHARRLVPFWALAEVFNTPSRICETRAAGETPDAEAAQTQFEP